MQKNRTSSLRRGFSYQNFWVLKICGEWLYDPEKYSWISFETAIDEVNPSKFYLDDIICAFTDNTHDLYQIKHKQNSEAEWVWDDFLVSARKTGSSLIKKWSGSLLNRSNKVRGVSFITNGKASDEVSTFLREGKVSLNDIKKDDTVLYQRIVEQAGDEESAVLLFSKLSWCFDQKNISDDEMETEVREFYYDKLKATEDGVTNLYHELDKACSAEFPQPLNIDTLKNWCDFDKPTHLKEKFEIPTDFEFFDQDAHEKMMQDLQGNGGGVKIIYGKPGVGKSVYLSKLDEDLRDKNIVTIKHHYHLSPNEDHFSQERLNSKRIIEAWKAQFKDRREFLGHLANQNSGEISIRDFISEASNNLQAHGLPLVLVIDGLDHPLRYDAESELKNFLNEVCIDHAGVWVVIGMQEVAKSFLPRSIIERCPEDKWQEIKGLSKNGFSKLIKTNKADLCLPDNEHGQLDQLIDKLFNLTKGNPLHTRYSLLQLKNANGKSVVTEYSCKDLLPYSGEIKSYYESIWAYISDAAKEMLITIASVNFEFTEQQLIECISFSANDPAKVSGGFEQISHLVLNDIQNNIGVFHNSFELFLHETEEVRLQKLVIKKNIKEWLEQSGYEYLRWAELSIIKHELGDSTELLQVDKKWLVDAICHPRAEKHIRKIMMVAIEAANQANDFAKCVELSSLSSYYNNSLSFVEEGANLIFEEAILSNVSSIDYLDIESLPLSLLSKIALIADAKGNINLVEDITECLKDLQDRQEYKLNSVPPVTSALLKVVPFDRSHDVQRVHEYILQFRDLEIAPDLFSVYSSQLLELKQFSKVKELTECELTTSEKAVIEKQCVNYGLKNSQFDLSSCCDGAELNGLIAQIYNFLANKEAPQVKPIEQLDFPVSIPEHDQAEESRWRHIFYESFLSGVLYGLSEKQDQVTAQISVFNSNWSASATKCMLKAGLKIAEELKDKQLNYITFYNEFRDLNEMNWPDDRDSLGFQFAFRKALAEIFKDLIKFKEYLCIDKSISLREMEIITSKPNFLSKQSLIDISLETENVIFTQEVYKKIIQENSADLLEKITYFSERTEEYVQLSHLARLHGDNKSRINLLKKSASNLLGYGYRKDTYLFDVLDGIRFCSKAGVEKATIDKWVTRVGLLIEYVGDYTDGAATNHLPSELADFLSEQNPGLLRKHYFELADEERFYRAEEQFTSVVRSLDYSDSYDEALARSAVDKDSFEAVKKLAQDNENARKVSDYVKDYLGDITYPPEESSSYTPPEEKEVDFGEIDPDQIKQHVEGVFENQWEKNRYLEGWLRYWLSKNEDEKVYKVTKEIIDQIGIKNISGTLLDNFFLLAKENDNEYAFSLICQAQINDHGWQKYWTDESKAIARWQIIRDEYQARYLEFFQKSTKGHVPVSKGVEFLCLFNEIAFAESVTEASVCFAESLVADTVLPMPTWITSEDKISTTDILLQRLLWPSPLVRERAADAIAQLLNNQDVCEEIFNKLLAWIKLQKMESMVAVGLLPIIRAFSYKEDRGPVVYTDVKKIASALTVNSIVIERLMEEISTEAKITEYDLPEYGIIKPVPGDYVINDFFTKHVKTFLAPVYMERANEFGDQFVRQWSYVADEIIDLVGIERNHNQVYFYARSEHSEFLMGFSTKISEALRSAFLRVLHHHYKSHSVSEDFYLDYAYATLPIDLTRWKIKPKRSPDWWPKLQEAKNLKEEKGVDSITFVRSPNSLVDDMEGKTVLAAEGAIEPASGWTEDPKHSFSFITFGYEVVGPELPEAEDIFTILAYRPKVVMIPSKAKRPFNFLEEKTNHLPMNVEPARIKDLILYPLVVREKDLCIGLWQYFRDYHPSFNLSYLLSSDLSFEIKSDRWNQIDNMGNVVVEYHDWLEGLKERYYREAALPHGQYLLSDKNFIEKLINEEGLRLGHVCKKTYSSKRYSYDDTKNYEEYQLFNVSNIIV